MPQTLNSKPGSLLLRLFTYHSFQLEKQKKCPECARILLQAGSSALRFKTAPLTNESKISLQSRSCSPANTIYSNKKTKCIEHKLFIPVLDKNTKETYFNTSNFYPILKVSVLQPTFASFCCFAFLCPSC